MKSLVFALFLFACSSETTTSNVPPVVDGGCTKYAASCSNGVCRCGASVTHAGETCCEEVDAGCTAPACTTLCCN